MFDIQKSDLLFEENDIFGKHIRTTKDYWNKIFLIKHKELEVNLKNVIELIKKPDEVRKSIQDPFICLYFKKLDKKYLVVVIKYLNSHGFLEKKYGQSKDLF